jgi:hypothetical protein
MHERGLAVDVTDIGGFQQAMSSAPARSRLIWFGPGDPVHFSTTGHARGGRARGFASGGRVSHSDLASGCGCRLAAAPPSRTLMAAIAAGTNPAATSAPPFGRYIDRPVADQLGQVVGFGPVRPAVNARNAVSKYRSLGLGAWVAYTNGSYRQYLTGRKRQQARAPAQRRRRRFRRPARSARRPASASAGGSKVGFAGQHALIASQLDVQDALAQGTADTGDDEVVRQARIAQTQAAIAKLAMKGMNPNLKPGQRAKLNQQYAELRGQLNGFNAAAPAHADSGARTPIRIRS